MKHFIRVFTILLSLLIGIESRADELGPNAGGGIRNDVIITSPQPWTFPIYRSGEQNLYTGTASVNIPIYTYKDPDFEIPVTLCYASNGLKPNQQAGSVGLGWTVLAGGYITRRVVGIRDDYDVTGWYKGYYVYHQNGWQRIEPNIFDQGGKPKEEFSSYTNMFLAELSSTRHTETTPDQFTFNFLDHSGQFSMEGGQAIHVYNSNHPHGEYKIDLSEIVGSHVGYRGQDNSCITITTGDGYIYTFRRHFIMGAYDSMTPDSQDEDFHNYDSPISYWPLTQITAPNGRVAKFEYGDGDYNDPKTYEHCNNLQWFSDYLDFQFGDDQPWSQQNREWVRQLRKITIDDLVIEFDYTLRTPEIHKLKPRANYQVPPALESPKRLHKISVYNKNTKHRIKNCILSAQPATKGNPVLLLTQVAIDGEGVYNFEYYDTKREFPAHATLNLDHWGYFNVPNNTPIIYDGDANRLDYLIPTTEINALNQETVTSQHRNPNFEAARMGMLRKITYPTHGFTTFEYQPHTYRSKVTRDRLSNNLPYLMSLSGDQQAGGVRIYKIADYKTPYDSLTRTFYYNYVTDKGNTSQSSGILLHSPRYRITDNPANPAKRFNQIRYPNDKYHIEYAEVMEKFSNNSFNVYHFNNYKETPDINYDTRYIKDVFSSSSEDLRTTNFYAEPYSQYLERGKLMSVKKYDASKQLKYKEENIYEEFDDRYYIRSVKRTPRAFYLYREYVETFELEKKRITEYTDAGPIVTTREFFFDDNGQLSSDAIYRNDQKINTHRWIWPSERSTDPMQKALAEMNQLASLIQEEVRDKNNNLIQAKKYTYGLFTGNGARTLILPKSMSEMKVGKNPTDAAVYTTVAWLTYNKMGRLVQSVDRNNIPTTYIWGYRNLFPVLKGANVSLNNVQSVIGNQDIVSLNPVQEEILRRIPGAEFTTYSYQPYVGILSETNPRGETIYYKYGTVNKLYQILKSDYSSPICSFTYSANASY